MKIYLSSSFSAFEGGEKSLMPLRRQLAERGAALGVTVVLAEETDALKAAAGNHIRILEHCARLAGECDAFFGVLFERHGTRVSLTDQPLEPRAEASFFEAELLEACLTEKPALVVVVRGAESGKALTAFLTLVRGALGERIVNVEESGIVSIFEDFARAVHGARARPAPWLLDNISLGRIRDGVGAEKDRPKLSFLSGAFRDLRHGEPETSVIEAALARAERGRDEAGGALGHIAKLSYIWLAMREFAKAPQTLLSPPLATQFDQALGLWNSSAAWYGLHGAHPMGCLAALNELTHIRKRGALGPPPHGARASAYYSVAARLRARSAARRFFRQTVSLASAEIRVSGGGYSLRASALARLATLGAPLRYFDALADYRREIRVRAKRGAGDAEHGEALTEYAYALGRQPWRRAEALSLMREGVFSMRRAAGVGAGFLARAERKFAELLARHGDWEAAAVEATAARQTAVKAEAFDQVRQIQKLLEMVAARRLE